MMGASEPADPLELDRQVCFALAVASRSVIAFYRPILEPLGLTHPQYLVMLALWQRSPLRFGEVATRLSLDLATLSPLVRRLETMGLVQRRRGEDDARVVELEPSDAGRALRERALAVPGRVVERLGFPVARLEALRDELTDLIAAVRRAEARPAG
ncbi:MAG: MarR family transcriptional regulator [Microbacteriaceae bacterium]|nr:MarR family transcriptional regulator [Microbacteriaceae bacterium]